jgi:hypothetical protein
MAKRQVLPPLKQVMQLKHGEGNARKDASNLSLSNKLAGSTANQREIP